MIFKILLIIFITYVIFGVYKVSQGFIYEKENSDKCYLYVIGLFFMANCLLGMFY